MAIFLAMLNESHPALKLHALSNLNSFMDYFWPEISTSVPFMSNRPKRRLWLCLVHIVLLPLIMRLMMKVGNLKKLLLWHNHHFSPFLSLRVKIISACVNDYRHSMKVITRSTQDAKEDFHTLCGKFQFLKDLKLKET